MFISRIILFTFKNWKIASTFKCIFSAWAKCFCLLKLDLSSPALTFFSHFFFLSSELLIGSVPAERLYEKRKKCKKGDREIKVASGNLA